jgi:single stranded DNA-binding protein
LSNTTSCNTAGAKRLTQAVTRHWTEEGQKHEKRTFVDVILWNRVAEIVQRYLRKGSPVFIEGRLQLDTWEDKQSGQKRSRLRVVCENMQLLGHKEDGGAPAQQAGGAPSRRPTERPGVPEPDFYHALSDLFRFNRASVRYPPHLASCSGGSESDGAVTKRDLLGSLGYVQVKKNLSRLLKLSSCKMV